MASAVKTFVRKRKSSALDDIVIFDQDFQDSPRSLRSLHRSPDAALKASTGSPSRTGNFTPSCTQFPPQPANNINTANVRLLETYPQRIRSPKQQTAKNAQGHGAAANSTVGPATGAAKVCAPSDPSLCSLQCPWIGLFAVEGRGALIYWMLRCCITCRCKRCSV